MAPKMVVMMVAALAVQKVAHLGPSMDALKAGMLAVCLVVRLVGMLDLWMAA